MKNLIIHSKDLENTIEVNENNQYKYDVMDLTLEANYKKGQRNLLLQIEFMTFKFKLKLIEADLDEIFRYASIEDLDIINGYMLEDILSNFISTIDSILTRLE